MTITTDRVMAQVAPYPQPLADVLAELVYKQRWEFALYDVDRSHGCEGLTLCIGITEPDTYHPERMRAVMHYFPVPAASFDARAWTRWLFDQIVLVERHEAMEFFVVAGHRPFEPEHGTGANPYAVRERD